MCELVRRIWDLLVCVRLIREPLVCVRVTVGEVGFPEIDAYIRLGDSGNSAGSDIVIEYIQTCDCSR